jgi:hypothetical protein
LRLVEAEQGAFFMLCSWCTKVRDILNEALETARSRSLSADHISRLEDMVGTVERMEANLARGRGREDVNTMRALLGMLTESEHLLGTALEELPFRATGKNFSALASDPAVARRASELYPGYYEQLWEQRSDLFRGKRISSDLKAAVEEEAQTRALAQAQRESARGAPLELEPGAPARTNVNPQTDIPFGFYNRTGFDQFSQRLYAALDTRAPGARLIVEGSGVTGRRFDRLVEMGPTGAPFGLGRVSDYDVAIASDSLFQEAQQLRIPMEGAGTKPLRPADIARLRLTGLDDAAKQGVLDATGIAYPVKFKIRPSSAPARATPLPMARGS